jgi:hypothetical protein
LRAVIYLDLVLFFFLLEFLHPDLVHLDNEACHSVRDGGQITVDHRWKGVALGGSLNQGREAQDYTAHLKVQTERVDAIMQTLEEEKGPRNLRLSWRVRKNECVGFKN